MDPTSKEEKLYSTYKLLQLVFDLGIRDADPGPAWTEYMHLLISKIRSQAW
jgi:hypothetical protein